MSDDAPFIEVIRQDPDDASRRLVYADWLQERGDPRAEYLRLGCQAAQALARVAQLREQLDPAWVAAMRAGRSRAREVRLQSGRTVYLQALRQYEVYAGLLEGLSRTEMNRRHINRLLNEERTKSRGEEPYLIRPTETPIEHRRQEPHPWGPPAALPDVACVGYFHSFGPARDSSRDCSGLAIIWFQDEFAFPIDPGVWKQLVAVDWEQHAIDGDY
jgi:uncharacterized protein (TIGR02996 family)